MKRLEFNDYADFVRDIVDKYDSIKDDTYNDISIIAKYEEAKQIIKELICIGFDLYNINIQDEEYDGYIDEYILSIINIDGKDEIWCEPMKRENGYNSDESTIIYILDNCSSKVISFCNSKIVYEVGIGNNGYNDNDLNESVNCDECTKDDRTKKYIEYSKDENCDMNSFTISKSDKGAYSCISFYSTEKLSKRDIQSLLQEVGF